MSTSQCSGGKGEHEKHGAFHCGNWCPTVPMTPISLDVILSACVRSPHAEGETTQEEEVRWIMTVSPGTVEIGIPILEHRLLLPSTASPRAASPGGHAAMAKHLQLLISVLCHQSSSSQAYFYSPEGHWAKCFGSHVTSKNTWNCFPPENGQEDGIYKLVLQPCKLFRHAPLLRGI